MHGLKNKNNQNLFTSLRSRNNYTINFNKSPPNEVWLLIKEDESLLWHSRISHIYMDHWNKLVRDELVIGRPKLSFENN